MSAASYIMAWWIPFVFQTKPFHDIRAARSHEIYWLQPAKMHIHSAFNITLLFTRLYSNIHKVQSNCPNEINAQIHPTKLWSFDVNWWRCFDFPLLPFALLFILCIWLLACIRRSPRRLSKPCCAHLSQPSHSLIVCSPRCNEFIPVSNSLHRSRTIRWRWTTEAATNANDRERARATWTCLPVRSA